MRRSTIRGMTAVLLLLPFIAGCAAASQRFVAFPLRGQPPEQLERDKQECEMIAQAHKSSDQAMAGAAIGAGGGAAAGAALGAVSGAFYGHPGYGAGMGAAAGATSGLMAGIAAGATADWHRYLNLYVACMMARGYALGG